LFFIPPSPGGGDFSACGRKGQVSACGPTHFALGGKVGKTPLEPAVQDSLFDCLHRWPPSGAPCRYVQCLFVLTRSFIEARRCTPAQQRLLYLKLED